MYLEAVTGCVVSFWHHFSGCAFHLFIHSLLYIWAGITRYASRSFIRKNGFLPNTAFVGRAACCVLLFLGRGRGERRGDFCIVLRCCYAKYKICSFIVKGRNAWGWGGQDVDVFVRRLVSSQYVEYRKILYISYCAHAHTCVFHC